MLITTVVFNKYWNNNNFQTCGRFSNFCFQITDHKYKGVVYLPEAALGWEEGNSFNFASSFTGTAAFKSKTKDAFICKSGH